MGKICKALMAQYLCSKKNIIFFVTLCFLVYTSSCSSVAKMDAISMGGDYCKPTASYETLPKYLPIRNLDSFLKMHIELSSINRHDLMVANALGVLPQLAVLKNNASESDKIQAYQALYSRVQLVNEEVDAVASELDCDGERTDQVANYLDNKNQRKSAILTASSIIVGAATTVAALAMSDNTEQDVTTVTGGAITAVLSIMTINPDGKKVEWHIGRNLLKDIWVSPSASIDYPASIWYFLNVGNFSNSGTKTMAESLKSRWYQINFTHNLSNEDSVKFFGNGGIFTADDMHQRASLINELQASVRSIHQDIAIFLNSIQQ